MRKEVLAGVVLALMMAAAVLNVRALDSLTEEIVGYIALAEASAADGEWENAEKHVSAAIEVWTSRATYTHIVLRHTDIEAADEQLYSLLKDVYMQDKAAVKGSALEATERINSILSIERIKIGSVF